MLHDPPDREAAGVDMESAVPRLMSAGLADALHQFDKPDLLYDGKVVLIALDAVVTRLGERWPMRREQVYEHVSRTLQRDLGAQGYFARVSETDVLICQPALSRYAAQASCVRYLREIITHFLGEADHTDICVHQVSSISNNEVLAHLVDPTHVEHQAHEEARSPPPRIPDEPEPPLDLVPSRTTTKSRTTNTHTTTETETTTETPTTSDT